MRSVFEAVRRREEARGGERRREEARGGRAAEVKKQRVTESREKEKKTYGFDLCSRHGS